MMKKIDPTVLKETRYIALWVLILSVLTQSVFLVAGKWDYTVLLGNLLSGAAGVANFLLMGISVQNAVQKDEKDARTAIKASQSLRMVFLLAAAVIGAALPCFNIWTSLIPLVFPSIAVRLRPLFDKKNGSK